MRFETAFEKRVTRSIEDWLADLGLTRYADAFVAAEIDLDVLAELTDADLTELGVLLGDRRRILRASAAITPAAARPQPRRPTVVYCDLVDATDLAVRLDSRELRAVMAAYHARCADVVAAHDGEAQYLGGGVMVQFSGGDASEAERATRCALALIAAIGELSFPGATRLAASIGLGTGSEAGSTTQSLAARLQRLAEPGTVLIGEATRELLGDAFTFTPLGSRAVSGQAERVEIWRVEPVGTEPGQSERRSNEPLAVVAAADAATSLVATAAVERSTSQPPAEPFVERHAHDDGDPLAALHYWQSELERAERLHDSQLRLEALHASWGVAFSIGDLSYTLDATTRGVALYDAARQPARRIASHGHDAGICAAAYRAQALIFCGRIAEGRGWLRRAETAIARSEHPYARCVGHLDLATARDVLGDYDVAIALANDARKLAIRHGFGTSLSRAAFVSAAARIGMGDRIAGMRALETVLDDRASALPAAWRAYYLVRLALAQIAAGNDDAAAARIAEAADIVRERGGGVAAAEIERAAAALLRLRGAPATRVSERLDAAAELARTEGASLLELRAVCDALDFALALPLSDDATAAAQIRIRLSLERIENGETTVDVRRARTLEQRALTRP